ncbi:MAG TPA: sensor histidine kinase [Actinomycetota bacterium]|nr:sensor histidine kinase [Actinomycetota bacterium]
MGTTTAPSLPLSEPSRPTAMDFLVAIIAGIVTMMLIHLDPETDARIPDGYAYGMGVVAAAALVFRRVRPEITLAVVLAVHVLYHLVGYPGAGPFPALMVALFGIAAAGLRWVAIASAVGVAATALLMQVLGEGTPVLSPTIIMPAVLSAASVFAGEAAHNRSRYLAEVRERISRVEQNREIETQRRLTEERLRIARELHDIMAHTITVITVQAGEAQDALDTSPEQTREALRNIREASKEAMSELRATVGVLRESGEPDDIRKPAPGMRDLPEMVQTAGGGSLAATLEIRGEPRPLPAAAELTAYRIVQESLTNVIRHSGAAKASVVVSYQPSVVCVEVEDDGRGVAGTPAGGHGIRGMRERAEAVGGRLEAGPRPEGGFRVWAVLPAERQP